MKTTQRMRPQARHNFKAAAPSTSLFSEKAVDQFLSMFTTVADPDEVLRKAGIRREMLRAVESDDEVTAATDTRIEALLAVPWRLEPVAANGQQPGGKREEFPEPVQWLWSELERRIEGIARASEQALFFGYSVQEAVYMTSPERARVTWQQITEKPFEWFIPRLDGTVLYRSRERPLGEEVDPRKFFLTARNQTYRNPYGSALYSRVWWPWQFRTQGWRFWAKWLERFGTPLLIGKTAGDAKATADALAKAVQDAAVAIGAGDDIVIAEQTSGGTQFEGFDRACCARIQKLILGQTLTTDAGGASGKSGSFALGQVHNEVRKDRRDADVRMVVPVVQRMVDVLWTLNAFPGQPPRFCMEDGKGLQAERAERDVALANAGIVRFTEDYLLRAYDYEPEDIEIPDPQEAIDAMQQGNPDDEDGDVATKPDKAKPDEKPKPARAAAGRPRFTAKQQVIEDQVERLLERGGLPEVIESRLIADAIKSAASPQDLMQKLGALLADANPADFRKVVERALFAADIMGYVHAKA